LEEAARGELLDPKLSPALLGEVRDEYCGNLERIWDTIPARRSSFKAAYQAPPVDAAGDLEALQKAYDAAVKRTFWEKLGNNYKDVTEYKLLLKEYGQNLLQAMHNQFIDAVVHYAR
jgi:hypothetical protein